MYVNTRPNSPKGITVLLVCTCRRCSTIGIQCCGHGRQGVALCTIFMCACMVFTLRIYTVLPANLYCIILCVCYTCSYMYIAGVHTMYIAGVHTMYIAGVHTMYIARVHTMYIHAIFGYIIYYCSFRNMYTYTIHTHYTYMSSTHEKNSQN